MPTRGRLLGAVVLLWMMSTASAAYGHGHFGQVDFPHDCSIFWEHSHTSVRIEASTVDAADVAVCVGYHAEIHYKVDGLYYSAHDWDTVSPWTGAHVGVNGYDVFYWSDHDAKASTTWYGVRKYH